MENKLRYTGRRFSRKLMALTICAMAMALLFFTSPNNALAAGGSKSGEKFTETVSEHVSVKIKTKSREDLFFGYVESSLPGRRAAQKSNIATGNKLDGINKKLYDTLRAFFSKVAAGETTSTVLNISTADLFGQSSWTSAEVGVADGVSSDEAFEGFRSYFTSSFDWKLVLSCLITDNPYEMYWYDKTSGADFLYGISASSDGITYTFKVDELVTRFVVAGEYANKSGEIIEGKYYETDGTLISSAKTAVETAKKIVSDNSGKSDYQKLLAYKNKICELVDYNTPAADDASTPYGNPWQLIWVFDGDASTKVVCEGYSKAFAYLCDLSTFKSKKINCAIVNGTMLGGTGAGRHMWNIVTMEDGKNYLVDVTNCDNGSVGYENYLFLQIPASGNMTDGYVFQCGGDSKVTYKYDNELLKLYVNSDLTLEDSEAYEEGKVVITDEPSETPTETVSEAPTETRSETPTETVSETPTETKSEEPTETVSEAPTETKSEEPTETVSEAPTETTSDAPTETVSETPTETTSDTPTETVSEAPTETTSDAPTETVSDAPTDTVTDAPTDTVTDAPTNTVTDAPTDTVTDTPTDTVTDKPTDTITDTPTDTVTDKPTDTVTDKPTEIVTEVPTETATDAPTETATSNPTATPTGTAAADPEPAVSPSAEPTLPKKYSDKTGNYTIKNGEATFVSPKKSAATVKIPDTITVKKQTVKVTAIGAKAFYKDSKLKNLTIGENVKTIGKNAFESCLKLAKVTGGSAITEIGASAFKGDKLLSSFPALGKLKKIGDSAFQNCVKIAKFTIGANVTTIGKNAFNGCSKLAAITIKTTKLTKNSFGANAFKGIAKKAVFNVPKAKGKAYKTILLKKGATKKHTFKAGKQIF